MSAWLAAWLEMEGEELEMNLGLGRCLWACLERVV